jgi:uncharacterized protein
MKYTPVVEAIYTAFGSFNIPGILQHLADDVVWEYGGMEKVPWLKHRQGHKGAVAFFDSLRAVEFHKFNPTSLFENGPIVLALIDLELTVKETGKKVVEEDEVHIWHFNEAGKVVKFRHRVDTLQHFEALQK